MALLTAAEARAFLPNVTGTSLDAAIAVLVGRFDALAAEWCGYPDSPGGTVGADKTLESSTYTIYLDGPDTSDNRLLWLGVYPVTAIGSIYSDPIRAYGSDTLVSSADYTLFGDDGLVELSSTSAEVWDSGARAIKVAFTAGFSTVPATVKQAAGTQVAWWFRGASTVGQKSVSQRGSSISLLGLELLPEVKQQLQAHVLIGGCCG